MARELLKFARLEIQAQDVGGPQGRKLVFNTQTGEVWVKKLNKTLTLEDVNPKNNKF